MDLRRGLASLALFTSITAPLSAQRTIGPSVLSLPSGPRSLALGGVGVTSRDDEVLFFNPGQLAVASGFSASGEHYSTDASGSAMSAVTRFNGGGVAIGMRSANANSAVVVSPGTPGSFVPDVVATSLEASVGLAQVVKGIRVGAAAKYVEESATPVRLQSGLLDLGAAKQMFGQYTVGAAVQNLGRDLHPQGATVELPRTATLGVSRGGPLGEFDLYGTAAVAYTRDKQISPAGGLEVGYSWLNGYNIAVRAGGRRATPTERGFTAGAGFTMDRLSIDYALETLPDNRIGHRVGLRIR